MRLTVLLFGVAAAMAQAQPMIDDDLSPQEAYARGFKEGWKQGYEQARKDLHRSARPVTPVIPAPNQTYPIAISLARYGTSGRDCDATHYVARRVNGRLSASVDASNSICGDPAPGERKSLDITYICGNRVKTASAYEHRTAYLNCSD